MKKGFVSLLFLLVTSLQLFAGKAEDLFAEGNKAYQAKDFPRAVELYEQLAADGYKSADLEYNLGNAWFRQGSTGRAILHFERALVLEPKHQAAAKNLAFLRSKIKTDIEPLPDFFLKKWWNSAQLALGATGMGLFAMLLWWAGFGALAVWLMGKSRQQKKWGLIAGVCLLVVSLLPFALAMSRTIYEKNSGAAILVQKTAILRSAPEDGSQEVLTIAEGTKLKQITQLEGWWQVSLENGETGWLPEQSMERI
jgi:tetratricopeptide (TPR) repeat protein